MSPSSLPSSIDRQPHADCQSEPLDRQALNDALGAAPSARDLQRQTNLTTALRNGFDPHADVDIELSVETYSGIEPSIETAPPEAA